MRLYVKTREIERQKEKNGVVKSRALKSKSQVQSADSEATSELTFGTEKIVKPKRLNRPPKCEGDKIPITSHGACTALQDTNLRHLHLRTTHVQPGAACVWGRLDTGPAIARSVGSSGS